VAEQFTPNYNFSYFDQYDINWHTGINNNFINLDAFLTSIEADVLAIGQNFIPHTLWQQDSNADGIPDLWAITSGSAYITGKVLQTSDLMGFAKKLALTLNNSSGVTQYGIITISNLTPPNTDITFSAWLKSVNLNVKLRIDDGAYNDGVYATYVSATRINLSRTLAASVSSVNLSIVIEIPDGTTAETVEIHLPMLNTGNKTSDFAPAPGEMTELMKLRLHDVDAAAHADIRTEIDNDIATHAALPNEHHTKYTDAEALAATVVYLPLQATLWHDESVVTVGNALLSVVSGSGQRYATLSYQNVAADGDTFTQDFTLKAGNYTLYALGFTNANSGKIDWYVDGVLQSSGQDWYSAGNVFNVIKTSSVTVVGNGIHELKGVVNGKNVASGGYFIQFTKMWIQ